MIMEEAISQNACWGGSRKRWFDQNALTKLRTKPTSSASKKVVMGESCQTRSS